MKWLINMNLPRSLKTILELHSHTCRHVSEIGLAQANDWEILREAKENNEVILTHDLDYGRLLTISGYNKPSVVIIRLSNPSVKNISESLIDVLPTIEKPLREGAIN
jgi:predicted nuclease of predicted toxin-antitoxin system